MNPKAAFHLVLGLMLISDAASAQVDLLQE